MGTSLIKHDFHTSVVLMLMKYYVCKNILREVLNAEEKQKAQKYSLILKLFSPLSATEYLFLCNILWKNLYVCHLNSGRNSEFNTLCWSQNRQSSVPGLWLILISLQREPWSWQSWCRGSVIDKKTCCLVLPVLAILVPFKSSLRFVVLLQAVNSIWHNDYRHQ